MSNLFVFDADSSATNASWMVPSDFCRSVSALDPSTFQSPLKFGSRVHIDDDRDLIGTVTGFQWRSGGYHTIEVSWMHNGASSGAWIESWRLTGVGK